MPRGVSESQRISQLPVDQRHQAISALLQKADSIGLRPQLRSRLRNYLNTTSPPNYSPILHLEPVQEWNGCYSLWNQFATNPATGARTFVQQHSLHTNEDTAYVTNAQSGINQAAIIRNAELENEYRNRVSNAEFPSAAVDTLFNTHKKLEQPRRFYMSGSSDLTVNSPPEELIKTVNILKGELRKKFTVRSSGSVGMATRDPMSGIFRGVSNGGGW